MALPPLEIDSASGMAGIIDGLQVNSDGVTTSCRDGLGPTRICSFKLAIVSRTPTKALVLVGVRTGQHDVALVDLQIVEKYFAYSQLPEAKRNLRTNH